MDISDSIADVMIRVSESEIERQRQLLLETPFIAQMLDAFPDCAAIINTNRQIVLANDAMKSVVEKNPGYFIEGTRIGEHMRCVNSELEPGGCGASEACSTCGSFIAQSLALRGKSAIEECCLSIRTDSVTSALDFRVYTSPLDIGGERFSVVSLVDIGDEKRRRILERIFFHDVNNTAGGIFGLAKLFPFIDEKAEMADVMQRIVKASRQLLDEIESQRDLLAAENNELRVVLQEVPVRDLLESVKSLYEYHSVSENRSIEVSEFEEPMTIVTDRLQLTRCLGNLVKNALEAIDEGQVVTLSAQMEDAEHIRISVHNPGRIPRDVELQMFHRSFTTKGSGRGLGTYSVKLLVERYLHGFAGINTSHAFGTEIFLILPVYRPE